MSDFVRAKRGLFRAAFVVGLMTIGTSALVGTVRADVNPVTPSTNDINRTYGWSHVDQLSQGPGTVTLEFFQPRSGSIEHPFYACFEYRTDGDTTQKLSDTNYNSGVTDGLYPYHCLNNPPVSASTLTETIHAQQYVEVRMVFGGETDERFDWTRFDVLPNPCTTICYVNDATGNDAFGGDTPGTAKKTIHAAVNQVTSGGTVIVAAGSYGSETISADKIVTIEGAQVGIDGRTAGRPGTSATESIVKLDVRAGNVTLDGFTFDAAGGQFGVRATYPSAGTNNGLTVRNSVIENGSSYGLLVEGGSRLQSMLIEQNAFLDNINAFETANQLWNTSPNTTTKTVQDNYFRGNDNADINLNWGAVTVSGNESAGDATLLVVCDAGPVSVTGNSGTFNQEGAAIFICKGNNDVTVSGNSLTGAFSGIRFSASVGGATRGATTGAVVTGNTITDAVDASISVGASSYSGAITIDHNIVANGVPGVVFDAGSGVTATGSAVVRNDLSGATTGLGWPDAGTLDGTCNWWGDAIGGPAPGGSGSAVGPGVAFVPWLTTSDLNGTCNGGTPRGVKQAVLAAMQAQALLPMDGDTAKKINEGIKHLTKSVDSPGWVDDSHLAAKGGDPVFDEEKRAVDQIEDIKPASGITATVQDWMQRLATADRQLATIACADGWCSSASSGDLQKYNDELAKGDVEYNKGSGHYDMAIDHYKNAWKAIKP
jgi:hypothetical protein